MLKAAQLYEGELNSRLLDSWYKMENIYWEGYVGSATIDLPDNNYESHHFVSVVSDNKGKERVIGYIGYQIDYAAMSTDSFGMISFEKNNLHFMEDVKQAIYNIFYVYNMNRMEWQCYTDNPVIRGYRNFIKMFGGREIGVKKQCVKLQDGKLHDAALFEILAKNFKKNCKKV